MSKEFDNSKSSNNSAILPISIEEEMSKSYLDYAMSVIVARAIPDARDGLKPVHRRILYSMHENGYTYEKAYRKCARVVGDVIGKYHPHGEAAVYDALVRMAQEFSMSLPLIDGQGNFGSVDGDPPAAMRYTESRMAASSESLVSDLEKDTVDFQVNYDNSEKEPVVLPARYPNLMVNGSNGIAVGMATNIPPHNLAEIINACLAVLENPLITEEELLTIIPGPDFPTGAQIIGRSGARSGLLTGRGSVIMRAKTEIEEIRKDRYAIIVTEIPYQVNKANMIEKIAGLVSEKRIEGISDLRDESDRHGMRIVIELKRGVDEHVLLNQLFRHSQLQTSFGINMLALNNGRPETMNLRQFIDIFLSHRDEVIARRAKHDLKKARDRAHILVGLACAVANIDEMIRLVRSASDPAQARQSLMERSWPAAELESLINLVADPRSRLNKNQTIMLTEEQAKAILELRLHRLTALGREDIDEEAEKLSVKITDLLDILRSRKRVIEIIQNELTGIKDKFGIPRRTEIIDGECDVEDEDLIAREDMVVTVTHGGYVKRTPLTDYRTQRRGGKGRSGMSTKEEDFVQRLFVATTHAPVLCFSSSGMVYKLKVWKLPLGSPQSKGKAFVNLLPLDKNETITSVIVLPEDQQAWQELDIMFATRSGGVRRNKLSDFSRINRSGKIAMKPGSEDGIIDVSLCTEEDDILLTTALGKAIRFSVPNVRVFVGRTSTGVRGIRLAKNDHVISMTVLQHTDLIPDEARAYMKHATSLRRNTNPDKNDQNEALSEEEKIHSVLSENRITELMRTEQLILTITDTGFGKISSSYDFRCMNRGGKGVVAHDLDKTGGKLTATFRIKEEDQVMLVTDNGQLIRCHAKEISFSSRNTKGVRIIRLKNKESVVSVERIIDTSSEKDEERNRGNNKTGSVCLII